MTGWAIYCDGGPCRRCRRRPQTKNQLHCRLCISETRILRRAEWELRRPMKKYTVTCIEQSEKGNWKVKTEIGNPFVLVERKGKWRTPAVVWLRDPHPRRTVDVLVPDWKAMQHRQLVGDELYEANLARLKAKRKAGSPKTLDRRYRQSRGSLGLSELCEARYKVTPQQRHALLGEVVRVERKDNFDGTHWIGRNWRGHIITRLTEDEAVQIAARLEDGRTVALQPLGDNFDCDVPA